MPFKLDPVGPRKLNRSIGNVVIFYAPDWFIDMPLRLKFHCRAIEKPFEEVLVGSVGDNVSTHRAAKTEMVIDQFDVNLQTGRIVSVLICEC